MRTMEERTNTSRCLSDISLSETRFISTELNIPGLIGIVVFYSLVLAVGIYASCRSRRQQETNSGEGVMLANRNLNEVVGVFTITATWVGGGYVNGTAEYLFTPGLGLIWCQAPLYFSLALIFNGVFFAKKMWEAGYVTMLDPFEQRYGRIHTAILYVVALFAEVSFAAVGFVFLGASLNVMIGISYLWAVILSAGIAMVYTLVGGLSSVAYTDVAQLIGIVTGLCLIVPFALTHEAVSPILETAANNGSWIGEPPEGPWISLYIDTALLCFFGAVPWQVYFQRVLAQKSAHKAMVLSVIAGFCSLLAAVPAVFLGAIASSTDWNATGYRDFGEIPVPPCDYPLALPLVMRFLVPVSVSVIGLGAISAAVMSSSDSCILSSSSMFAHNIYRPLRNGITDAFCKSDSRASDVEIVGVLRVAMFFVGAAATVLAITVKSVVALIVLSVDLPYCIIFPQLLSVIYIPMSNGYGSLMGLLVAVCIRTSGGEPYMNLKPLIRYPWYDELTGVQLFPLKTFTTATSLVTIVTLSWLAKFLHTRFHFCKRMDAKLLKAFQTRADIKEASKCKSQPSSVDELNSMLGDAEPGCTDGNTVEITSTPLLERNRESDENGVSDIHI